MEIAVILILFLVTFCFVLKLSFHNWWGRLGLSALAALFLWFSHSHAIDQSKTQIADWLSQPQLMLDSSVFLTVDIALQIGFCILMAISLSGHTTRSVAIWTKILLWLPGIVIFPTLFSLLVEIIFSLPGYDFSLIAASVAASVFIIFPLLAAALKYLLPETNLRLELMFIVNLLVAALGIVATVNGRTAAVGRDSSDPLTLGGVALLFIASAVCGYTLNRIITANKISKIK